jgi:hypothetical protein
MGSPARGNRELYSSWWYVFYSSFASDIDLLAAGPGGGGNGEPCRRIIPFTSGNLVVKRPDGTSITLTGVAAGVPLDIQAMTIVSAGTTITSALVCW